MEYTDPDTGITLRVFSSMYVDWGLEISHPDLPEDVEMYYSPCALGVETYGFKPSQLAIDEEMDLDFKDWRYQEKYCEPWDDDDWKRCLKDEFDDTIDAFIGWHNILEQYPEIKI